MTILTPFTHHRFVLNLYAFLFTETDVWKMLPLVFSIQWKHIHLFLQRGSKPMSETSGSLVIIDNNEKNKVQ